MSNNEDQERSSFYRKAALDMIMFGVFILLIAAACTSAGMVTPTPGQKAWRWQPSPSPQIVPIARFNLPTSTPDPLLPQIPEPTPTVTSTPTILVMFTPSPSLAAQIGEIQILTASPTVEADYSIVATYIRQKLIGTNIIYTTLPNEKGLTPVKWWGQNTQLTICVKFDLLPGNTPIPPPASVTFVIYHPDTLQPILEAIPVATQDQSIQCGMFGKKEFTDPPLFNPFDLNKKGIFGIGFVKNQQIITVVSADAEWAIARKTPTPAAKTKKKRRERCDQCHPWPLPTAVP